MLQPIYLAIFAFALLMSSFAQAGTCGGVTHPNIKVNPFGDYGLVPSQFSAVCEFKTAGIDLGFMEQNLTLNKQALWVLKGMVNIGLSLQNGAQDPIQNPNSINAAVLTLDAGVTVVGDYDAGLPTSDLDFLVVQRGSQIFANGTVEEPVHITSLQAITGGIVEAGQWGGLVLNGYAGINNCSAGALVFDCEAAGSFGSGQYGGNDNDDSSGALNYLIIENAGFAMSPNNAFAGLSFNGVGNATQVEHLQINNAGGVGVNVSGGTVALLKIILTKNLSYALQWQNGWTGAVQQLIATLPATASHAIVGGNGATSNALPQSHPTIANATIISESNVSLVSLENNTAVDLLSLVVSGVNSSCFVHNGVSVSEVTVGFSWASCNLTGASQSETNWFVAGKYNNAMAPLDLNGYVNGQQLSAAITIGMPDFSGIAAVGFIGAVGYCEDDWTQVWSKALPLVDADQCVQQGLQVPLGSSLSLVTLATILVGIGHKVNAPPHGIDNGL